MSALVPGAHVQGISSALWMELWKEFLRLATFPGDLRPVFLLDYAALCTMMAAPTNVLMPQEDCKQDGVLHNTAY